MSMKVFVGITGASGHPYALRLVHELTALGREVSASITDAGCKVMRHEVGLDAGDQGERLETALREALPAAQRPLLSAYSRSSIEAPPSSGTSLTGGVVLCPCSMGTLARVAAGFSSNLVERAADVALKERRRLVIVPRETPLSEIHLENMLRLTRLGAIVLPAMPGFYHDPRSIEDLTGHVVGKILDALDIQNVAGARWRGLPEPAPEEGIEPGTRGHGGVER